MCIMNNLKVVRFVKRVVPLIKNYFLFVFVHKSTLVATNQIYRNFYTQILMYK